MTNESSTNFNRGATVLALLAFVALFAAAPAYAQGVEKVNTFIENVLLILRTISIGVVTIAVMWAGYKYLFKHADLGEVGKILAGGLLIGGAAELANFLLS